MRAHFLHFFVKVFKNYANYMEAPSGLLNAVVCNSVGISFVQMNRQSLNFLCFSLKLKLKARKQGIPVALRRFGEFLAELRRQPIESRHEKKKGPIGLSSAGKGFVFSSIFCFSPPSINLRIAPHSCQVFSPTPFSVIQPTGRNRVLAFCSVGLSE